MIYYRKDTNRKEYNKTMKNNQLILKGGGIMNV